MIFSGGRTLEVTTVGCREAGHRCRAIERCPRVKLPTDRADSGLSQPALIAESVS